jgi:hypothetical protein
MPVGAGDTFRIGDTVSPKELELRFSLYPHVGTTAVVNYRVLVVEYFPMSVALTEAKVQSDIFPDFDSSVNFFSGFYNHDTRSEFKVHYDKRITLSGNQPSIPA